MEPDAAGQDRPAAEVFGDRLERVRSPELQPAQSANPVQAGQLMEPVAARVDEEASECVRYLVEVRDAELIVLAGRDHHTGVIRDRDPNPSGIQGWKRLGTNSAPPPQTTSLCALAASIVKLVTIWRRWCASQGCVLIAVKNSVWPRMSAAESSGPWMSVRRIGCVLRFSR